MKKITIYILVVIAIFSILVSIYLLTKKETSNLDNLDKSLEGEKCLIDSECADINCSGYDNDIKLGYKPSCVSNGAYSICKCMCYGCK